MITKKQILEQLEKQKLDELPENLVDQEVKILSEGMKDDQFKKSKKTLQDKAKKRIKTGLILNAFGEKNEIKVSQDEINVEIQKQFRMMPGQETIVKDYYEKNPAAIESLRGSIYEEKIINEIKKIVKINKKEISKTEAEKILKSENEKQLKDQESLVNDSLDQDHEKNEKKPKDKKTASRSSVKKTGTAPKKNKQIKKVSKK